MGNFFPPIAKVINNIWLHVDGSVSVNYLVQGINFNTLNEGSITSAQRMNELFFSAFKHIEGTNDFMLAGIVARIERQDTLNRMVKGVDFFDEEYKPLQLSLQETNNRILSGELEQTQRLTIFSVTMSSKISKLDAFISRTIVDQDNTENISLDSIREFEETIYNTIPQGFQKYRTNLTLMKLIHDRVISRGMLPPPFPKVAGNPDFVMQEETSASYNRKMFTDVEIRKYDEHQSVYKKFIEDIGKSKAWTVKKARRLFTGAFKTLKYGTILGIHQVNTRTDDMPDGLTSYQTLMGVGLYPTKPSYDINLLTGYIDQHIGVDADYALRWSYAPAIFDTEHIATTVGKLEQEARFNAKDEYEHRAYVRKKRSFDMMEIETKDRDRGAVGIDAAYIFAFGSANIDTLKASMLAVKSHFSSSDVVMTTPPNGQATLWMQMIPGSPIDERTTGALKQITTARLLGASIPLRESQAGDPTGLPIAQNIENRHNQLIYHDIKASTDKGVGSILFNGSPRSGKSFSLKKLLSDYLDLRYHAHIIDVSETGEYVVYASGFTNTTVVDFMSSTVSLDILKIFGEDAQEVFMSLYLPLLEISPDSDDASILAQVLTKTYREIYSIVTTRDLIDHLKRTKSADGYKDLIRKLEFWSRQQSFRTFVDPVINAKVEPIAPFTTDDLCVVFRTHNLKPPPAGKLPSLYTPEERFTVFAYRAIARITERRFTNIDGPCVFVADEVSVFNGTDVVETVMKAPARTGAKSQNSMLIASQLAQDLSDHSLIKKVFTFRQDSAENSIPALIRAQIPPLDHIVDRHIHDTSPEDISNGYFVPEHRRGECWYTDGYGNTVRARALGPIQIDRAVLADTTSSSMQTARKLGLATDTRLAVEKVTVDK